MPEGDQGNQGQSQTPQPSDSDYIRALYQETQRMAQNQQILAQQNQQLAQALAHLQQQPPQAQPLPSVGELDQANHRVLQELTTNPLRVIKEIKDAAVLDAKRDASAELERKLLEVQQMAALREYERQVMAANPDLTGWEHQIAGYIVQTDPNLPYQDRVKQAIDATRAFKAQTEAEAIERARRDTTQRIRAASPAGGQGTQLGAPQGEPELSELELRQKVVQMHREAQQRGVAGRAVYARKAS